MAHQSYSSASTSLPSSLASILVVIGKTNIVPSKLRLPWGYKNYIRCSASVPGEAIFAFIHIYSRMGVHVQTVVIGNVPSFLRQNGVNQGNRIYVIVARTVDKNSK